MVPSPLLNISLLPLCSLLSTDRLPTFGATDVSIAILTAVGASDVIMGVSETSSGGALPSHD